MNPPTLNAVMRLQLRLTRDFDMACLFAERSGVENLLALKEKSSFSGALPLTTMLIRHVVENNNTLAHAIERTVVVASNAGVPDIYCGVGQNSIGAKELNYLLRALGPIACRDSSIFSESMKKILRLVIPNSRRGQLDETIPPNSPQIVKVPDEMKVLGLNGLVQSHAPLENLVGLLLRTLVERYFSDIQSKVESTANPKDEDKKKNSSANKILATPQVTLVRRLTGEHIDEDEIANGKTFFIQTYVLS